MGFVHHNREVTKLEDRPTETKHSQEVEKNAGGKKQSQKFIWIIIKGSIFVHWESEMERNGIWDTYLANNSHQGSPIMTTTPQTDSCSLVKCQIG